MRSLIVVLMPLLAQKLEDSHILIYLERYTEIERENRILLEKMSNIMQNPKPSLYNPDGKPKKSLNREKRRQDLVKITLENQAFLKRLQ